MKITIQVDGRSFLEGSILFIGLLILGVRIYCIPGFYCGRFFSNFRLLCSGITTNYITLKKKILNCGQCYFRGLDANRKKHENKLTVGKPDIQ